MPTEHTTPETVTLMGVRPDGSTELLGQTSMPPKMKMLEITRDYFGQPDLQDDSACDDATMCYYAMDTFLSWLVAQGWQAPPAYIERTPQVPQ